MSSRICDPVSKQRRNKLKKKSETSVFINMFVLILRNSKNSGGWGVGANT
ncbi:MAG: hypothetical protein KAK04_15725 [Cyclobacteriaceae bacterium]|nr:hypothetical protein [Cyclobacteriaceae bacterium]